MKTSFLPLITAVFVAASIHPILSADAPGLEDSKNRDAIDALQGKPAPALSVTNWLNSKPLTADDHKRKECADADQLTEHVYGH